MIRSIRNMIICKGNKEKSRLARAELFPLRRTYSHKQTLIKREGEKFVEALEKVGLPISESLEAVELPIPEGAGLREIGESILEKEKLLHRITGGLSGSYYVFHLNQQVKSSRDISWVLDSRELFYNFRDFFEEGLFQAEKDIGFGVGSDCEGTPYFGDHLYLSAQIILPFSHPEAIVKLKQYSPPFRRHENERAVDETRFLPTLRKVTYQISKKGHQRSKLMDPFGSYSHWRNINFSEGFLMKMPEKKRREMKEDFSEFLDARGKYCKTLEEFTGRTMEEIIPI